MAIFVKNYRAKHGFAGKLRVVFQQSQYHRSRIELDGVGLNKN
jgi:hypothetical protein